MVDILVSEAVRGPAIDALAREWNLVEDVQVSEDPDRLAGYLPTIRAWIVRNRTQVTADALAKAPRLQVVGRAGVGLDNIDCQAAEQAGVVVAFTPRENSLSVAELAIGLMIAWLRHLPQADRHVREGGWDRPRFLGGELAGRRLGIVGLGRIGCLVAERANVFGMDVVGYDAYVSADDPRLGQYAIRWVPWNELLEMSDIISCHVPLTPETRHLIDADALARMKPTALLVNTARGEIVDEAALLAALKEGQIAGAALDVREREPPYVGALEQLDNVLLTPHIGAFTHEAQERVVTAVAEDVARVLRGEPARQVVGRARPGR